LSRAAEPFLRIPVGVVIERRKAQSQWADFIWRPVGVLPDEPDLPPWTVLREEGDARAFYVGSATIDLYRSETSRYRENLSTGAPGIWVVLAPSDGEQPYTIAAVTADPAEGEGFAESASYLVEQVVMPETVREAVERFVAEHHVEQAFVKRQRRRVDPEALAKRGPDKPGDDGRGDGGPEERGSGGRGSGERDA
jgi:hypothetical protein